MGVYMSHLFKPLSSQPITISTFTDQSQSHTQSQILFIRHSLLSGQLTATQLAYESFLTRLRLTEPRLRCFLHVSDTVLRQANELDENECRQSEFYLPWKCENERHIYEKCEYELVMERMLKMQKIREEEAKFKQAKKQGISLIPNTANA